MSTLGRGRWILVQPTGFCDFYLTGYAPPNGSGPAKASFNVLRSRAVEFDSRSEADEAKQAIDAGSRPTNPIEVVEA